MNKDKINSELQYNGHCAFAMSTGKKDVKGGGNVFTIGDRSFGFSNPVAKLLFRMLPNRIEKADLVWNTKSN